MATSSSPVVLDTSLTCEDAFAEIERHVRAGVHPDRIRLRHNERALYWVCNNSLLHHDGPDEATIARRIDAHLALISLLLAAGADPNKAAGRGATPLFDYLPGLHLEPGCLGRGETAAASRRRCKPAPDQGFADLYRAWPARDARRSVELRV